MATQIQKPAQQEKRALIVDLEEQDKNNKFNMIIHGDDTSVPPLQQRKCTDTGCLILFLLIICGLIGICAYANIRGDTDRLTHGHDFRAELCGIQGLKHLPYVYWPKPHIELDYVQCIQTCPNTSNVEICLYNTDHYTLRTDLECPPSYESYLYNGIYCLPSDQSYRDRILNDVLMLPMEIIKRSFGDMQRTWDVMGAGILVSVAVSILYFFIFLLKPLIGIIISWIVALLCTAGVGYLAGFEEYDIEGEKMCGQQGNVRPQGCDEEEYAVAYTYIMYIFAFFVAVQILVAIFVCKYLRDINDLIKLSSKIFSQMKLLPIFILIFMLFGGAIYLLIIWFGASTMSLGSIVTVSATGVPGATDVKTIEYQWDVRLLFTYDLLVLFQILGFLGAFGQNVVAIATSIWFFSNEKSALYSPVGRGLKFSFRYHLGSIIKGSFINQIFRIPRLFCLYLRKCFKKCKQEDSCVICMEDSCKCCLNCYQSIRYYTRYYYIQIGLFGEPVGFSSKRNFFCLERNAQKIKDLLQKTYQALFITKIGIAMAGMVFTYYMLTQMEETKGLQKEQTKYLFSCLGPSAVVLIGGLFVGQMFTELVRGICDAQLYCIVTDEEMFQRENRHITKEFKDFMTLVREEREDKRGVEKEIIRNKFKTSKIAPGETDSDQDDQVFHQRTAFVSSRNQDQRLMTLEEYPQTGIEMKEDIAQKEIIQDEVGRAAPPMTLNVPKGRTEYQTPSVSNYKGQNQKFNSVFQTPEDETVRKTTETSYKNQYKFGQHDFKNYQYESDEELD